MCVFGLGGWNLFGVFGEFGEGGKRDGATFRGGGTVVSFKKRAKKLTCSGRVACPAWWGGRVNLGDPRRGGAEVVWGTGLYLVSGTCFGSGKRG